jgi:hypothetical protein
VNAGGTDLLYAVFVQALKGRYGDSHVRSPAGIPADCRRGVPFDEPSARNCPSRPFRANGLRGRGTGLPVTQGVARGLLRFRPSGWTKDGLTLIAAGKTLTRLSLYATLPSCTARHGKIIRTITDLEAGKPG